MKICVCNDIFIRGFIDWCRDEFGVGVKFIWCHSLVGCVITRQHNILVISFNCVSKMILRGYCRHREEVIITTNPYRGMILDGLFVHRATGPASGP